MIEQGPASEDAMVLAFVRAEINSPKWGRAYDTAMQRRGLDLASVIGTADHSAARNRRDVLGDVRGYGLGVALFEGFPADVRWRRVVIEPRDLPRLKYIRNDSDWLNLTGGTRLVQDGARNLASNATIADKVRGAQRDIEQGRCPDELILVEADDGALVIVEGHTRATAYAVLADRSFPALVGTSPHMGNWSWGFEPPRS